MSGEIVIDSDRHTQSFSVHKGLFGERIRFDGRIISGFESDDQLGQMQWHEFDIRVDGQQKKGKMILTSSGQRLFEEHPHLFASLQDVDGFVKLGSGAHGEVYEILGTNLVVKKLHSSTFFSYMMPEYKTPFGILRNNEALRLICDRYLPSELGVKTPHYYGAIEIPGNGKYVVMDKVEGVTLEEFIQKHGGYESKIGKKIYRNSSKRIRKVHLAVLKHAPFRLVFRLLAHQSSKTGGEYLNPMHTRNIMVTDVQDSEDEQMPKFTMVLIDQ